MADGAAHPLQRPVGPIRPVYDPPAGEVLYGDAEDRLYIDYRDRVRVLCDPGGGEVQLSLRSSEPENLWLASHPLFTLPFVEVMKRHGRYSLHAAGLCVDGRALLLAGSSGAGKSTLALALLRAGFRFLGDDMCFLATGAEGLRVLAFPDEIDVTDDTARLFPELSFLLAAPARPRTGKRQLLPEDVYEVEFVEECRPGVLVFPRIAHTERSTLTPMDPAEALLELAPNVLLTEPRASQAHLDALAQLVCESGCYRLDTGRDFDELPQLLGELLT